MSLSDEAKKARALYMKNYRKENEEQIKKQNETWRMNNKQKIRDAQNRYWEKKGEELQQQE